VPWLISFSLDTKKPLMQFFLFAVAKVLQRLLVLLVALPALAVVATPVILVRAWALAAQKRQAFRHAAADGYDFIWSLWTPLS
jgi:hypothetical protein